MSVCFALDVCELVVAAAAAIFSPGATNKTDRETARSADPITQHRQRREYLSKSSLEERLTACYTA
jgi:hypothetical protein